MHTLNRADTELVPILVKVQLLQTRLLDEPDTFGTAWNWIDAFLRFEHSEPTYLMLRQAMASRRALLLLDGLDEGGEKRAQIERHATEVLAPQGHVLLATSRPDGIDDQRYAGFRRLELKPLSVDQQRQALEQRLGAERASSLLPYLERMPVDERTQERITANPLMLSMVASLFELRSGLAMPETGVDLSTQATAAMLGRAGVARRRARAAAAGRLLRGTSGEPTCHHREALRAAAQRVEDNESALEAQEPGTGGALAAAQPAAVAPPQAAVVSPVDPGVLRGARHLRGCGVAQAAVGASSILGQHRAPRARHG